MSELIVKFFSVVAKLLAHVPFIVVAHELGHFAAAYAFKRPISSMHIGVGPQIATCLWKGIRISLYALPIFGYVRLCFLSSRKLVNITIFAAGPAANFLGALFVYALLHDGTAALMWLMVGIGNLLPQQQGKVMTDGLQILKELRR
jgi:membrane-associated protease RseP (regulator of RpoE activity)